MKFRIKISHLAAIFVLIGIAVWMSTGELRIGGQANVNSEADAVTKSGEAQNPVETDTPITVRVVDIHAQSYQSQLEVRGRTEADAVIAVKAETSGVITKRFVSLGDYAQAGQLLCRLDAGTRTARVLQERAQLAQAQADHNASKTLEESGFVASNRAKASRAALDAALARLAEAELELKRTEITTPVSGIVQDPIANVGELLSAGHTCATLIDTDPILMTGQISERDIGNLSIGMTAHVDLITGQRHEGKIKYIASSADAATRTFRIDIEIENKENSVRDGLTAVAQIPLPPVTAHRFAPSMLTLSDTGALGVRIVDMETNKNTFQEISILHETTQGVWVSGLPETVTVIAVGQDYVTDGQIVHPVYTEAKL